MGAGYSDERYLQQPIFSMNLKITPKYFLSFRKVSYQKPRHWSSCSQMHVTKRERTSSQESLNLYRHTLSNSNKQSVSQSLEFLPLMHPIKLQRP